MLGNLPNGSFLFFDLCIATPRLAPYIFPELATVLLTLASETPEHYVRVFFSANNEMRKYNGRQCYYCTKK